MATIAAALANKNIGRAISLIHAGAPVNALDAGGRTALRRAVFLENRDVVTLLLSKGANPNGTGPDGTTPLIGAAMMGNPELVRILLAAGANPLQTDMEGLTAIGHVITQVHEGPNYRETYEILRSILPSGVAPTEEDARDPSFKVLCDTLGYEQHGGECWIDTIQQLFFFSDKLKDFTQPLFYHMTDAQLDEYIMRAIADSILMESHLEDFRRGFKAMRDRFIHHYNYIRYDKKLKTCKGLPRAFYTALLDSATLNRRVKSGELATIVGATLQSNLKKSSRINGKYIAGEITTYGTLLFTFILHIFRVPFLIKTVRVAKEYNMPIYALTVGLHEYAFKDGVFDLVESGAHATGFLRCNHKWFFYDDNRGVIPVDDMLVHSIKERYLGEHKYIPTMSVVHLKKSYKYYFFIMDGLLTKNTDVGEGVTFIDTSRPRSAKFKSIWFDNDWQPYGEVKRSLPRDSEILADLMKVEEQVKDGFDIITSVKALIEDPTVAGSQRPWAAVPAAVAGSGAPRLSFAAAAASSAPKSSVAPRLSFAAAAASSAPSSKAASSAPKLAFTAAAASAPKPSAAPSASAPHKKGNSTNRRTHKKKTPPK